MITYFVHFCVRMSVCCLVSCVLYIMGVIVKSSQRNFTKGRIAAAHEWFSGIGQVAPVCTPTYTCFLDAPEFKSQTAVGSVVFLHSSRQTVTVLCNGRPFPHKIALSHRGSKLPSSTWFLGPTRVLNPNGISIGSAIFP